MIARSSSKKVIDRSASLRESELASYSREDIPLKSFAKMKMPSKLLLIALALSATSSLQAQSRTSVNQITRPRTVASAKDASARSQEKSKAQSPPSRPQVSNGKKAANHFQQDEARGIQREESNRKLS